MGAATGAVAIASLPGDGGRTGVRFVACRPAALRGTGRARRPVRARGTLGLAERDVLRAVPEHELAQLLQALAAFDDRREVIPCELSRLAGEACVAVREEQLGLAEAAG